MNNILDFEEEKTELELLGKINNVLTLLDEIDIIMEELPEKQSNIELLRSDLEHLLEDKEMGSIGYKGYWHMGIRAVKPIKVVKDMKCCQIYYLTADGDNDISYHGYMQNLSKEELGSPLYKSLIKKYRKDDFKC